MAHTETGTRRDAVRVEPVLGSSRLARSSSSDLTSDLPRTFRKAPEPREEISEHDELPRTIVAGVRMPFWRLALFFLKAVVAAIPALVLLGVILFFMGQALEAFFPDLVKLKILIYAPPA